VYVSAVFIVRGLHVVCVVRSYQERKENIVGTLFLGLSFRSSTHNAHLDLQNTLTSVVLCTFLLWTS
jgi:hypothetical protein